MSAFSERLEEGLALRKISAAELSKQTGISEGAISQYRKDAYKASQRNLEKIARALRVSIPWLMGVSDDEILDISPANIIPLPNTYKVPLVGDIACGLPITAIENFDETVNVPEYIHADFALRCKGDSMINARIFDGDIVYIRKQEMVENGEIAAVRIEDEATLKKVYLYSDRVILEPANPTFDSFVFRENEMNKVAILGKVVGFTSTNVK